MHQQTIVSRFILIEPSHAGNVGAVARALKVMGFADLVLVRPRWADVLQRPEALERASGAADVLAAAQVVDTLDAALDGITHLCATAMTARDFGPPTHSPRPYLSAWARSLAEPGGAAMARQGLAFLFGPERYGLSNADVYRCHASLRIPTAPAYGSLNLAAAVQLIAYEWRLALLEAGATPDTLPASAGAGDAAPAPAPALALTAVAAPAAPPHADAPADAPALAGLLAHWEQALLALGYLDAAAPRKLMPRLNQLLNRAQPTQAEVQILRGVAAAALRAAAARKQQGDRPADP